MKEVDWGVIHGEGTIECCCDECSTAEEFDFQDGNPPYREVQNKLFGMGWKATKVSGKWCDFCSEICRNQYIKKNT